MALALAGIVILPLTGAAAVPLLAGALGRWAGLAALAPPALGLALLLGLAPGVFRGDAVFLRLPWVPELGLEFHLALDGWSLLFALLILGIGALVILYAMAYLGAGEALGRFYAFILLFMGAMLGVVLAGNLLLAYVFWELTSVSSFLLIGFWHQREASRYGAFKSLLITVGAGFAMLTGLAMMGTLAGTLDYGGLVQRAAVLRGHPWAPVALVLVLAGAFAKSAQVPFHIWLPDAMAAPTPVSAYLHSATMVKAGLYLVGRLWPLFAGTDLWAWLVTGTGLATMVLGGFLALRKTDLKAILAMSTVSQLGFILALLGLGTPAGVAAAAAHIVSHATFKATLFLAAGIVEHETGTRDVRQLGGLARHLPLTCTLAVAGSLAMAGVPPFNGFVSKEMFFAATLGAPGPLAALAPAVAVAGSVLTVAYCGVLGHRIWFGPVQVPGHPHEAPPSLWLPPALLAALSLATGLAPGVLVEPLVAQAAAAVQGTGAQPLHMALWHGVNLPLAMGAVALAAGVALYGWVRRSGAWLADMGPRTWHVNALFDWLWWSGQRVEKFAKWLVGTHMTGLLRDYLVGTLGVTSVAVLVTAWSKGALAAYRPDLAPVTLWEGVLLVGTMVGAVVATLARTRMVAVAALGLVGLPLAMLFALLRAPDLALTQIVVEIVTAILFLLVFAHLPQLKHDPRLPGYHAVNLAVAVATGAAAFCAALLSTGVRLHPTIATYYLEQSLPGGGGANVVNVTLVDFRGLDTLFEITVIAMAALGVYTLIKLRLRRGGERMGP